MSSPIIHVENLGKKYLIRHQQQRERYTALRDILAKKAASPFLWLRRALARVPSAVPGPPSSPSPEPGGSPPGGPLPVAYGPPAKEDFWALKDVSFEVQPGEVVGIIGRNGAGKSTLLKILSRITEPTTGRVRIKGRVASLLEVGTGFHPELTGRENIFLNGAILGMSREEIRRKFDEIVTFAEVEKFLDTPVKRYSSGMYVRLAFAVAAHLEAEILVVDEVLAVGDAEFQKRCVGKMQDVASHSGRTVLFVSHQMGMISRLCSRVFLMEQGKLKASGFTAEMLALYGEARTTSARRYDSTAERPGHRNAIIQSVETLDDTDQPKDEFAFDESLSVRVSLSVPPKLPNARLNVCLLDQAQVRICSWVYPLQEWSHGGSAELRITLPARVIAPNRYSFLIEVFTPHHHLFDRVESVCPIRVFDNGSSMAEYEGYNYGSVILPATWWTSRSSRT